MFVVDWGATLDKTTGRPNRISPNSFSFNRKSSAQLVNLQGCHTGHGEKLSSSSQRRARPSNQLCKISLHFMWGHPVKSKRMKSVTEVRSCSAPLLQDEMLRKRPDSSDWLIFWCILHVCSSRSLTSEYVCVIRKTVAKDLSGPDPRLLKIGGLLNYTPIYLCIIWQWCLMHSMNISLVEPSLQLIGQN